MFVGRARRSALPSVVLTAFIGLAACYDWTVVPNSGARCRDSDDCDASSYCVFPDGECGRRGSGRCAPRGKRMSTCAKPDPVCTCAGTVEDNRCIAAEKGEDLTIELICQSKGLEQCGFVMCAQPPGCEKLADGEVADFECISK